VKRGRLLKEGQSLMVPAPTTDLSPGNGPLVTRTLSFLSSRAKPRDLRFSGTFLETLSPILNKFVVSPERSVTERSVIFPQLPGVCELLVHQLADGMQQEFVPFLNPRRCFSRD
jgi:hypothetical protein